MECFFLINPCIQTKNSQAEATSTLFKMKDSSICDTKKDLQNNDEAFSHTCVAFKVHPQCYCTP